MSRSLKIQFICGLDHQFGSRRFLRQKFPPSRISPLAPLALAAVTPKRHTLRVSTFEDIRPDTDADIVGISYTTPFAARANALADRYKELGVPTVAGGVHASLNPDDARQHFTSVVKGAGELAWPKALLDFERGSLQRVYTGLQPDTIGFADRTAYPGGRRPFFEPVEVTRGCPVFCGDFCTVPPFAGRGKHYKRPVEAAVAEMESLKAKTILLCDNNLVADVAYAKALFERMVSSGKTWAGAATVETFNEHNWLAPLMRRSGCLFIFMGLESLQQQDISRNVKVVQNFEDALSRVHDAGIGIECSFMLGLPHDTKQTLSAIPGFVDRNKIEYTSLNILTPYPGTGLFARLDAAGRILTKDWSKYDEEHVVFKPDNFSPGELQTCYENTVRQVFSLSSMTGRTLFGERIHPFAALGAGLATRLSFELGMAGRAMGMI